MERKQIEATDKEKIIGLISAILPEAKIYLYGSFARGTPRSWSDIDIALEEKGEIDYNRIAEIKDILDASNILYKFDIVDITSVSEDMRNQILKDRVIWKN